MLNATKIGIVIIGRNEGKRLIRCFNSVLITQVPLIYVDSQSSDSSVREAQRFAIETIILDSSKPLSAARARNEGVKHLIELSPTIEYIHFMDGDCELDSDWLTKVIPVFEKNDTIAVVCGRLREKDRNTSIYRILCDIDWYCRPGIVGFCGGIATYRRTVFEFHNGFDDKLIAGEEPELCSRIRAQGGQIMCIDAEMATHDSAMTQFSQWWTRCVKVGYGCMNAAENWQGWSKPYNSALFWGLALPFTTLLTVSISSGWSLLIAMLYPVQTYRIFTGVSDENLSKYDRFIYAVFCTLAKFPQSQGLLLYLINKIAKQTKMIQYK